MKTPIPITKNESATLTEPAALTESPTLTEAPEDLVVSHTVNPTVVMTEEEDDTVFAGNDRVPALWNIEAREGDEIEATNSTTGSYFLGTMADFKKCMRG